jgi:hypothetical protein
MNASTNAPGGAIEKRRRGLLELAVEDVYTSGL